MRNSVFLIRVWLPPMSVFRDASVRTQHIPTSNKPALRVGESTSAIPGFEFQPGVRRGLPSGLALVNNEQSCGLELQPQRELDLALACRYVSNDSGRAGKVTALENDELGCVEVRVIEDIEDLRATNSSGRFRGPYLRDTRFSLHD